MHRVAGLVFFTALFFPALLAAQETQAAPKTRVKLGTVSAGAGYARFSGPGFFSYPYFYRPFYWDPYWSWFYGLPPFHPGYFSGFYYAAEKGEVRLQAEPKTAQVYLDGAYAGNAGDLKSMWLDPGAYSLSLTAPQRAPFEQRIYVLTGKTLKISATLAPEAKP